MKWFLVLLVAAVSLGAGGFWWWSQQILPPDAASTNKVAFVVAKNQTAGQIIEQLSSKGLIRSPLAARIFSRVSGLGRKLQAGSFVLTPQLSLAEVFQVLTGPPADVWVTIPEGWRREQIAARMQTVLSQLEPQFVSSDFLTATATLEGQLFPDTYLIPISATTDQVVSIMTTNFAAKAQLNLPADRQILILASLVEREANSDSDRPTVAGILWKRFKAGWPLQVDAAVQYGQDTANCRARPTECKYWLPVTDTHFPSAFNTYIHPGLPPSAIANPGLASIQAAKNPAATPYWFYLHAADGSVYYARTIGEHNSNIDKYLRQ